MVEEAHRIRLFVTDVDGTLTDGSMYYTAEGDHMKRFNTRDGMGLEMLREIGVEVAIMTGENSDIVLRRAEKLGISRVYIGIKDKLSRMKALCEEMDIPLSAVAYAGDDVNDLEVMKNVGLSFAVADATRVVFEGASVKLTRDGGRGAVREAAEWIIANQGPGPWVQE
jgi:YrbI family 3-deoxy-D-manno-octulosonate 8-phosphate phosphatase